MNIPLLGIIIIVIYTAIILFFGIRVSRSGVNSTGKSFFLGNGTKTFVLLFTTVASTFSTWVIMGAPTSTFTNGHTWIGLVALYQITMTISCGYLGPRFWVLRKEHDLTTQSDLVVKYYGSNIMRYIMGTCFIIAMFTGTIAQFKAMGIAISTMTNGIVPYWGATLYIAIIVGVYVFFGGFQGQALIDTFMGILFTVILWGGLFLVVYKSGGFSTMFIKLAAKDGQLLLFHGDDAYWDAKMAISFSFVAIIGGMVHPGFWQRYYAAKTPKTLIRMSVWFPIMSGIGVTLSGGLVGLAANLYKIDLSSAESVFQTVLSSISSPYWSVAVTLGVLAAGMSTVAGNMNCASMIITYDFVHTIRKGIPDKKLRNVGRGCILVLMLLGYIFSLRTPESVTMLIQLMAAFNMMAFYPVFGIFIWKRASVAGCISAMTAGLVTIILTVFVFPNPMGIVAGAWGFAVGIILFFVVSLLTKPISPEAREVFLRPLKERKASPRTVIR